MKLLWITMSLIHEQGAPKGTRALMTGMKWMDPMRHRANQCAGCIRKWLHLECCSLELKQNFQEKLLSLIMTFTFTASVTGSHRELQKANIKSEGEQGGQREQHSSSVVSSLWWPRATQLSIVIFLMTPNNSNLSFYLLGKKKIWKDFSAGAILSDDRRVSTNLLP